MNNIHRVTASYLFFVLTSLILLWSFLAEGPDNLVAQEIPKNQNFTTPAPTPANKELPN